MNCIIASTSTLHGSDYLAYLTEPLQDHFKNASEILFIPFARPGGITHEEYTEKAKKGLAFLNKKVVGIHEKENFKKAILEAEAIFTGGGNTFVLVSQLYTHQLIEPLQESIKNGTPYLGTSAGSNICGVNMRTTNDMPIVYPPNFNTLEVLPFNINPHYLDPDPTSTHKGETRETRIKEFHEYNATPVVGLREGSWLVVTNEDIVLKGKLKARIFQCDKTPYEIEPETSLKNLQ
ncbi:dipeptidase PepE [Mesonia aquimarina]|uniref:dipeptidase PepE n=1 Tax=Mesonia aquimarina TaxID=1504967 RepID=UPI000EF5F436|nr:dipeptidase PepE [Mesonia aquimarina]